MTRRIEGSSACSSSTSSSDQAHVKMIRKASHHRERKNDTQVLFLTALILLSIIASIFTPTQCSTLALAEDNDGATHYDDPLTPEEREILNSPQISTDAPPPPELQTLLSTIEAQSSILSSTSASAMEQNQKIGELLSKYATLTERTKKLNDLVRTYNAKQLNKLSTKLNQTLQEELKRRERAEETKAAAIAKALEQQQQEGESKKEGQEKQQQQQEQEPPVTIQEMEQALNLREIIEESEAQLENYIFQKTLVKIDDIIYKDATAWDEKQERKRLAKAKQREEIEKVAKEVPVCATPIDAANMVHERLVKFEHDGIGRFDHLRGGEGASVVYGQHMTSETFDPSSLSSVDEEEDGKEIKLGEVSWRKYIPEDWEQLLPDGWEDWDLRKVKEAVRVPGYVYHSLGIKGGPTNPPESILNPNTNLGSCWPMSGRDGQITLRLPYAVKVDAVTIDHVPMSLTAAIGDANSSAPRFVRLVGYPPCSDEADEECGMMGFDVNTPLDLGHFEYKLPDVENKDGGDKKDDTESWIGSVQTFNLGKGTEIITESAEEEDDDEGEEDSDPTMCSAVTMSCGEETLEDENTFKEEDDSTIVVEGVTLIVEENWGNPDYTCIYRFRVHGDVAEL